MRDVGAPYSTLSAFTPATDGQWRDFAYDFRLSPHPQEIALFIYLSSNGTLDLQKLKLVGLSEQDLIAEIKAKYPQAGSGNLVNVSTFPLGLQSGWSIDRDYSDGDQVQVDSDAAVPGPSGCSALRIDATVKGIRVYSAPFAVPWSFETHVLSVSVRGDWRGKLIVTGGHGQVCATAANAVGRPMAARRTAFPADPVRAVAWAATGREGDAVAGRPAGGTCSQGHGRGAQLAGVAAGGTRASSNA